MDFFEYEELDAENVISLRLDLQNIKEFYNAPDRCFGTGKDILNTNWVFGCFYDPTTEKYNMSAIGEELENVRCDVTFSVVQPRDPAMERLVARPINQRRIVRQFFQEVADIPGGEWETVFTDERYSFENWAFLGYVEYQFRVILTPLQLPDPEPGMVPEMIDDQEPEEADEEEIDEEEEEEEEDAERDRRDAWADDIIPAGEEEQVEQKPETFELFITSDMQKKYKYSVSIANEFFHFSNRSISTFLKFENQL
ncbi:hypothetical protein B9Z55_023708 [Caenorhabditis nigoni]|uniref:Uncharacterized protein n=1 Tax=Caenorhabditis nigoni TaxID=1611254 RepID=A0A2G5SRD0_9PELO|nr:hypothetical protein B9Z55_023708 [Caenorhabditis nigoni]